LQLNVALYIYVLILWAGSSVGIATRYRLDGLEIESRCRARFSAPVQIGPGTHTSSYTVGTGSLPGVMQPGRDVDHPPPSSTEVKERVELYFYSTPGPSWLILGRNLSLSMFLFYMEKYFLSACNPPPQSLFLYRPSRTR